MMVSTAPRLEGIGEYYFSQKLREIEQLNSEGKAIINLGIGSPDLPPHERVINTLQTECSKANVHAYQNYKGRPELRQAIANWYKKWYNVTLNPATDILPLIGSKEGIMHICMSYFSDGDKVLVPNPGYPTYTSAVKLSGATPVYYNLEEDNQYEPHFDILDNWVQESGGKIKAMFVNYPHMPTGKNGSRPLFEKIVAFGNRHGILIIHDNPYSFILNEKPLSLLEIEESEKCVLELNSLSKSHNMAGWRVGMLCGSQDKIDQVLRFKSNMDSGMFMPLQMAAVTALTLGEEWHSELNATYKTRREKVFEIMNLLDCIYDRQQVGLFVWGRVPSSYENGFALSDEILYGANVFITPGGIFGTGGDAYIRISLCGSIENFEIAIERIKNSRNK